MQRELLKVDWPKGLLEWAECAPECDDDGVLLWRGPRVKVGMAVGHDAAKRPLNTGVRVRATSRQPDFDVCSHVCMMSRCSDEMK